MFKGGQTPQRIEVFVQLLALCVACHRQQRRAKRGVGPQPIKLVWSYLVEEWPCPSQFLQKLGIQLSRMGRVDRLGYVQRIIDDKGFIDHERTLEVSILGIGSSSAKINRL